MTNEFYTEEEFLELLDENSYKKFHCEYNGFFSNHLAHGIIALYYLGANKIQMNTFMEHCSQKLEFIPQVASEDINNKSVKELLGKGENFTKVCNYYHEECASIDLKTAINVHFPHLYKGVIGSITHPLIHLGYGCLAKSKATVIDALAYIHYNYYPKPATLVDSDFGKGDLDMLSVLKQMRNDNEFLERVKAASFDFPSRRGSGKSKVYGVLYTAESDALTAYVNRIKFPDTVDLSSLESIRLSMNALLELALHVYLSTKECMNEFFLLHGVTSCFALKCVLNNVDDYAVAKDSIRVYVTCLLCVYIFQGCPLLHDNLAVEEYDDHSKQWKRIVAKMLSDMTIDEHIFKLVHVCQVLWSETNSQSLKNKCIMAADVALENDLTFLKF